MRFYKNAFFVIENTIVTGCFSLSQCDQICFLFSRGRVENKLRKIEKNVFPPSPFSFDEELLKRRKNICKYHYPLLSENEHEHENQQRYTIYIRLKID